MIGYNKIIFTSNVCSQLNILDLDTNEIISEKYWNWSFRNFAINNDFIIVYDKSLAIDYVLNHRLQ